MKYDGEVKLFCGEKKCKIFKMGKDSIYINEYIIYVR